MDVELEDGDDARGEAHRLLADPDVGWRCASSNLKRYGFVRHQFEGFDLFMSEMLPDIVRENSDIVVSGSGRRHVVRFGNITIHKPTVSIVSEDKDQKGKASEDPVMPWECRVRKQTYANTVTGNLLHEVHAVDEDGEPRELLQRKEHLEVPLFKLPCMLRSRYCWLSNVVTARRECPMDQGGYFIINGVEKVLLSQLKLRGNMPFVFASKGTAAAKYSYVAEVRSVHAKKWRSTSTLKLMIRRSAELKSCVIVALLPFVLRGSTPLEVPLICLWRAMESVFGSPPLPIPDIVSAMFCGGRSSDWDADGTRALVESALRVAPFDTYTPTQSVKWLEDNGCREKTLEKRRKYMLHIISNEVLPHVDDPEARRVYLGLMVRRMVAVELGHIPADDRDHNANKRLDGPGYAKDDGSDYMG